MRKRGILACILIQQTYKGYERVLPSARLEQSGVTTNVTSSSSALLSASILWKRTVHAQICEELVCLRMYVRDSVRQNYILNALTHNCKHMHTQIPARARKARMCACMRDVWICVFRKNLGSHNLF